MHSDHYRCVVHVEQIMCVPKDEGTRTVDEAARDYNSAKRRRGDLVASRGSSFVVSWIGEPL